MQKKTIVIHLIGHLKIGGAENLVRDYGININKEKFKFIVVTLESKKNTINEKILNQKGIEIIYIGDKLRFDNSNIFKRLFNKFYRRILFLQIIKKVKPDIIHTHLNTNDYVLLLNKNKVKLFHTVHSDPNISFGKGKLLRKIVTHYCIKHKKMIPIALHKKMKKEVNKLFKTTKCITLPNGIDIKKFQSVNKTSELIKKELNINKNSFIIGHVGRFTESKNHLFLIKIFYEILKKKKEAILVLVGSGESEPVVKDKVRKLKIEKSVIFLGDRDDIPELMSIMDVFVFPSKFEGFGNVLIEAQAAGLKCVVSENVPEEVSLTNLVVSLSLSDSITKWCEEILTPFNSTIEYKNIIEYDIKNVVKKLENIYLNK